MSARREPVLLAKLDRAVDRRMDDDAARVRLVGVHQQIELGAEPLGHVGEVELRGRGHRREAARPLENARARREPRLRQERGAVAVLRRAAGMKRLAHRPEHLAHAGRLRAGQAERPDHLLLGEPHQLADGRGRAEDAGGAGDVPAEVVVRRVDAVGDARRRLEAVDERLHEVAAAHRVDAGVGEERRGDRRRRVAVVLRRRVVVVVDVRADAVHQRRVQRVEPLVAAEHVGRGCARERPERADGGVHRLVARAAHRAAHEVDQRAARFAQHLARECRRAFR